MADAKVWVNTRLLCLGDIILMTDALVIIQPHIMFDNAKTQEVMRVVRSGGAPLKILTSAITYGGYAKTVTRNYAEMIIMRINKPLKAMLHKESY